MGLSGSGINEEHCIVSGNWIAWLIDNSIGTILSVPFRSLPFCPRADEMLLSVTFYILYRPKMYFNHTKYMLLWFALSQTCTLLIYLGSGDTWLDGTCFWEWLLLFKLRPKLSQSLFRSWRRWSGGTCSEALAANLFKFRQASRRRSLVL